MIDLRSDTVTLPSQKMKEAMFAASLGDDVFNEDPTVNLLQEKAAQLFGQQAGLFCASGTLSNQLAIAAQTASLDEIIVDRLSHIYNYETAGYAHNSRVGIKLIESKNGIIKIDDLKNTVSANYDWLAHTSLLSIENTCNKGGGSFYTLKQMKALQSFCQENNLKYHLDGARLFNALVETSDHYSTVGQLFDSISLCFSKGLGTPVGSVLLGSNKMIAKARRLRKVMGGGMRQAGILAAACLYALENNVDRLVEDHNKAKEIGNILSQLSYVEKVAPVQTNIVIFSLIKTVKVDTILSYLAKNNIQAVQFGPREVRFVTHLDFTENQLESVIKALKKFDS